MIGRIKGLLLFKSPPHLMVDVSGVGYELEAPMSTFYQLPEVGSEVSLFTHMTIREDAHLLFAFASENERVMFRTLIKVNGVGAKMALTILSGIETDDFARCIRDNDTARLTRLPGVGKKTAERLVVEMRDRLKDFVSARTQPRQVNENVHDDPAEVAISALISLGYKPQEASRFVHAVVESSMDSESIIRAALKASITK